MNTLTKWVVAAVSVAFLGAPAFAGKGGKPGGGEPPPDPCVGNTSFFPALAFDTAGDSSGNSDLLVLASADGACQRDVYLSPGDHLIWKLRLRSEELQDPQSGQAYVAVRLVWQENQGWGYRGNRRSLVYVQDFRAVGNTVQPLTSAVLVASGTLEDTGTFISEFDLAPDGQALLMHKYPRESGTTASWLEFLDISNLSQPVATTLRGAPVCLPNEGSLAPMFSPEPETRLYITCIKDGEHYLQRIDNDVSGWILGPRLRQPLDLSHTLSAAHSGVEAIAWSGTGGVIRQCLVEERTDTEGAYLSCAGENGPQVVSLTGTTSFMPTYARHGRLTNYPTEANPSQPSLIYLEERFISKRKLVRTIRETNGGANAGAQYLDPIELSRSPGFVDGG